jgi:hypothetical protein
MHSSLTPIGKPAAAAPLGVDGRRIAREEIAA